MAQAWLFLLGATSVLASFDFDPTPPNNYTASTKGCPCFFDQKKTTECPCCVNENACPCSWPYDDRCGDCNTGHGCLPEPINEDTLSDRGCTCQEDEIFGLEKGSCACCTPYSHSGKHICPCAFPYHHMCVECSDAQVCENHAEAALYKELYPLYFKPVQAAESLMISEEKRIASGSNICHEIPHKIENGFTICDKIPKKGKACVFFCDEGFKRIGNYRKSFKLSEKLAECICSELGCNWNDEPSYELPVCVVDPCAQNPCENGGNCESDGADISCSCKPGFLGDRCEVALMSDFVGDLFVDDVEEPKISEAPEFRDGSDSEVVYEEEEEEEAAEAAAAAAVSRFARRKKFGKNKDRNTCPPLDGGMNGGLRCTKGFKKSSTCHLICDEEFAPSNTKFAKPRCICNSNRCSWDRSSSFKLAKCSAWPKAEGSNVDDAIINGSSENSQRMLAQQTKCPPLVKPANGNVRCTEDNKDGSRCQFLCKKGFNVSKARFARCACKDGKCIWNQEDFYVEPFCEDKDECALDSHNCADDTTCVNKPGSFVCVESDSQVLRRCDSNPCGRAGECSITAAGYKCECKTGFKFAQGTCVDVDECQAGIDKCFSKAICENFEGGYSCRCPSGYGDGLKECLASKDELTCTQKRSFRTNPLPNYVAPNACCLSTPFNTDLNCCCEGKLHPVDGCPCLLPEYF